MQSRFVFQVVTLNFCTYKGLAVTDLTIPTAKAEVLVFLQAFKNIHNYVVGSISTGPM